VKAFNHVYAELLVEPAPLPSNPSVLFCGDDASAKQTVRTMIESCGLDAVDVGELSSARFLEPMAMLTVRMVRVLGNAPNAIAWKVLRGTDAPA
jgi:predicted dinucleotide-binding enzyme